MDDRLEFERRAASAFVALALDLRREVLRGDLAGAETFTIDRPRSGSLSAGAREVRLVVLPRAVAISAGGVASDWYDLVIGADIPPTITRWVAAEPIPAADYEMARSCNENVAGLEQVLANRRHFGLDARVLLSNLQRAIARYRLAS